MIKYLHGDIMKSLKFKLISEKEIIINEETSYFIKEDILNFKIKEELYNYNLSNNILIKKNKESTITFDFENYNIIIEIPENNLMFNMEITEYNIVRNKNSIEIKYKYMGDKITTNCIIIEY